MHTQVPHSWLISHTFGLIYERSLNDLAVSVVGFVFAWETIPVTFVRMLHV
eukprot:m.355416 g.355416  ORF g.355416 m.355416 type:complete len:51 (+) comp17248_c0_seq1:1327-1479(+)